MPLPVTKLHIYDALEGAEISPLLFSNFMEQLGYSADGGALAQALANPTLERDCGLREGQVDHYLRTGKILTEFYRQGRDPQAIPDDFLIGSGATGFGVAALDDFRAAQIPFPWAPLGVEGGVNLSVGRIGGAVRLRGFTGWREANPGERIAVDDGPAGLRQGIFLPFQRCLAYHGHLWVRIFSTDRGLSGRLEVGFRRRLGDPIKGRLVGEILACTILQVSGIEWSRVTFRLTLAQGQVDAGEPVDFYFRWLPGDQQPSHDLLVDRALLLPDDAIEDTFDPDVVRLCKELRPTLLRWPGGNFVSHYHWRDGVGPLDRRPTRGNPAWGGLETNFFGTGEFFRFCQLIGAQPHITVNTGTGSPEEAADWVEYCNSGPGTRMGALRILHGDPAPYDVKIWEVGNEIHGSWQGGYHGADENVQRFVEFARAMRGVDPGIRLIATGNQFDIAEPGPRFDFTHADQRWNRKLFEEAAPEMDYLSLHSLPGNTSFAQKISHAQAYYALMAQPVVWERTFLPELAAMASAHPNRLGQPARIAITEWGILGSIQDRPEVRNYGSVPYAGVFYNSMARMSGVVEITEATALLHGGAVHKAAGEVWMDPQCLVIQRYAELGGARRVHFTLAGPVYDAPVAPDLSLPVEGVLFVDTLVARLEEGNREVICLVNIALDQEAPLEIEIDGDAITDVRWEVIACDDITAIAKPNQERFRVVEAAPTVSGNQISILLPACSVSWISFRQGSK